MKRNWLSCLLLAIAMMFTFTACTPKTPEAPQGAVATKDTLVVGADREPVSLDPSALTVSYARLIEHQIYDTLLKMDENLNIVGELAESWRQLDDLTWEFKLRKGVKFHNGDELTSKDVLFTFKRLYDLPPGSTAVKYIDPNGYETPDDHTFILRTTVKYAFLEAQLCSHYTNIVCERAVREAGEQYARNPVGTGPYKFVSWAAGDNITVERFDDYWGADKPKIKTIKFRFITEQAARTINLESGDIDLCIDIPENDAERIRNGAETNLVTGTSAQVRYLAFNCQRDIFKDKRVRQAIAHATDVETIRKVIYGEDTSTPGVSPVPPGLPGRNEDLVAYEYNVEKAKQLMAEAGVSGLTVKYIYLANSANNMMAEMLQEMYKEIGVTLELNPMESGALSTAMNKGEQDFCVAGTSMEAFDAGKGLYDFFHTNSIGSTTNRTYLASPDVDAILNDIVVETDSEERARLVYEVQKVIHEECPMIVICYQHKLVGMRKNVGGFVFVETGNYDLNKLYFTE
ncbi:MAG: ABC transporter substrate-binding protein [Bacillota bacterium]|jgi:peptide/nickel transport system substrate-binding protein